MVFLLNILFLDLVNLLNQIYDVGIEINLDYFEK